MKLFGLGYEWGYIDTGKDYKLPGWFFLCGFVICMGAFVIVWVEMLCGCVSVKTDVVARQQRVKAGVGWNVEWRTNRKQTSVI